VGGVADKENARTRPLRRDVADVPLMSRVVSTALWEGERRLGVESHIINERHWL
jgi:hypothetical protein